MITRYKCRRISGGYAEGLALVSPEPISFYGGVDPKTGMIVEEGHPLYGERISGKILIFPHGKGSTVGSYIILRLAKRGLAPKAIINSYAEPIVAVGAIISDIPMVDGLPEEFFMKVRSGDRLVVDADKEEVIIEG